MKLIVVENESRIGFSPGTSTPTLPIKRSFLILTKKLKICIYALGIPLNSCKKKSPLPTAGEHQIRDGFRQLPTKIQSTHAFVSRHVLCVLFGLCTVAYYSISKRKTIKILPCLLCRTYLSKDKMSSVEVLNFKSVRDIFQCHFHQVFKFR